MQAFAANMPNDPVCHAGGGEALPARSDCAALVRPDERVSPGLSRTLELLHSEQERRVSDGHLDHADGRASGYGADALQAGAEGRLFRDGRKRT